VRHLFKDLLPAVDRKKKEVLGEIIAKQRNSTSRTITVEEFQDFVDDKIAEVREEYNR
jgi:chorismate-pyruvate lyase